jgi:hypothetical protein
MSAPTLSEAQLIKTIRAHIAKGDHDQKKAEQHYTSAGQHLETLKKCGAHKLHGLTWEQFVKEKCGISRERADQLIRIGNGTTTVEKERADTAQRMQKLRAEPVSRDTGHDPEDVRALASVVRLMADDQQVSRPTPRALPPRSLQGAWDAASAAVKQEFIEANVVELTALLAELRKRAVAAVVERASEQLAPPASPPLPAPTPTEVPRYSGRAAKLLSSTAPIAPFEYPELPTFLDRSRSAAQ